MDCSSASDMSGMMAFMSSRPRYGNRIRPPVNVELPPRYASGARSSARTRSAPAWRAAMAAHKAAFPAPTTMTSYTLLDTCPTSQRFAARRRAAWGLLYTEVYATEMNLPALITRKSCAFSQRIRDPPPRRIGAGDPPGPGQGMEAVLQKEGYGGGSQQAFATAAGKQERQRARSPPSGAAGGVPRVIRTVFLAG